MKSILTAIPLYNNAATILAVVDACLKHTASLLVVDDGSTDLPQDFPAQLETRHVTLQKHPQNAGKGEAILTALHYAKLHQFDYLVILDADGQHLPDDLPRFFDAIQNAEHETLFIGCRDFTAPNVPRASRFGRAFSNFWVRLETGISCQDTQSGFRAYPVHAATQLSYWTRRYNFEIEILVRLLWGGVQRQDLPIRVVYEPGKRRVSHFRPLADNMRLSLLHTALVSWRLLPLPRKRVVSTPGAFSLSLLRHPVQFLKYLLQESTTPVQLANAAAVGSFIAVLPIFGFHTWVILYFCFRLNLNKILGVAIQNLFAPPFSPFLCIELGYWMRHGHFLTRFAPRELLLRAHELLYEWFLGSLLVAPVAAMLLWVMTYLIASVLTTRKHHA